MAARRGIVTLIGLVVLVGGCHSSGPGGPGGPPGGGGCTSSLECPSGSLCADGYCSLGDCYTGTANQCPSGRVCIATSFHVGRCQPCGDAGQPCCGTHESGMPSVCGAPLLCSGQVCVECGHVGEECCLGLDGGTCDGESVCGGNQCVAANCGNDPTRPCPAGAYCSSLPDAGPTAAGCVPCGGAGQQCCPPAPHVAACAPGLACDDLTGTCDGVDAGDAASDDDAACDGAAGDACP